MNRYLASVLLAIFALASETWSTDLSSPATEPTSNSTADKFPDPVSGNWDVTFEVEGNKVPGKFQFQLTGNIISGTADSAHTGPGTVTDGFLKGDRVEFTLKFAHHDSIMLTGTTKDGKLSGELRTEGRSGIWSAVRR